MDLREFIDETISGIIEATSELQIRYEGRGVMINPPVSADKRDLYAHEDKRHTFRRAELIEFDVAVTAASESGGGGKVGLKVFSAEANAGGQHARSNQEVRRVKFSLPIVLTPTLVEEKNRAADNQAKRETQQRLKKDSAQAIGGRHSWMGS